MTLVSELCSLVCFSCCVKRISKGKRKKKLWIDLMGEKGDWLVIDFESPDSPLRKNETRPDFPFAGDTGGIPSAQGKNDPSRIVPIEIRGGGSKSNSKISSQIQSAADWVDRNIDATFHPSLVPIYLGPIDNQVWNQMKKNKAFRIRFRGQREIINLIQSGENLPKPSRSSP